MLKKLIIDLIMIIFMIVLMSLNLTGSFIYELLGLLIIMIILIHLFLNIKIIKNIIYNL